MQWLFDIVIEQMENAGFIRISDVETYLKGMIVMWSGDETNIPDGWALCDGTQNTPNLFARFILGFIGPGSTHTTGGNLVHNHNFTGDGHSHTVRLDETMSVGDGFLNATTSDPAIGTTDNASHIPVYYVLAFIMKL